jgi:uncharacterized membrane-anchored protein YjiN (DUF445 family)
VNAAAEASMVGAIADWFAVTALFRHPLGLPIPHTALVPKRKNEIGASLEEFVLDNFLAEEVIRGRVEVTEPALRFGRWLSEEKNARWLVGELSTVGATALGQVRDEHVSELFTAALFPRLLEEPMAPLIGASLEGAVADNLQHGLVDLGLTELYGWLSTHEATVMDVLAERAPWWTPEAFKEPITRRLHQEVIRWVADIRDDPHHRARKAFDSWLEELAHDLQHNPATQERAEGLKTRLLEHPQVLATTIALWNALRKALTAALRDPDGALHDRIVVEAQAAARRIVEDAELRTKLDTTAANAAVWLVKRYGKEATAVITHTIERWDGREASERIELHVGRDLQFIRINGTIVGGLAGLLIHTISVLVH